MGFQVNLKLVPIKALNFLFYAGLACYLPYKPIFQKQLGLSSTQNGLIQASDKIIGIVSQPISGAIADKTKSIKTVMIIWFSLAIIFVFPMYFVPPVEFPHSSLKCCSNNSSYLSCEEVDGIKSYCQFSGNTNNISCFTLQSTITGCSVSDPSLTPYNTSLCDLDEKPAATAINMTCLLTAKQRGEVYGITFSLMFFLTIVSSIFLAPAPALIDATAMQALGKEQVQNYGLQRLWGAVGYGLIAFAVGLITDTISNNQGRGSEDRDFLFAFICVSVFLFLTAAVCFKVEVVNPDAKNIFVGVASLLKQTKIIIFFLMVYFSGCSIGLQFAFLFWYVVTLPGSSQTILGLAIVANVVAEIPLYIISGRLAKKTSYNFLLFFGLFCYGLRFMGYSLMTQAWHVILIETLHGPSFALPVTAMNAEATILSPRGMVATTVGLTQAIYWGLGYTTGALVGGFAYNSYGPISTFRGMMILCFVVSLFYAMAVKIEEYYSSNEQADKSSEDHSDDVAPSNDREIELNEN